MLVLDAKQPPALDFVFSCNSKPMFFIKKQSTVLQMTFDGIYPDWFPDFRRDIGNPTWV